MKKYLVAMGLVLALAVVPMANAQTLNIAQLQAIVLQLQAQLNFLIAQLAQLQQQENNSQPIVRPIESIKPRIVVSSPNGGESYVSGRDEITAKWSGYNLNADAYYKVYLYSPINGEILSYSYPTQGGFLNKSYSFFIPHAVTTGQYKVGVCALNTERPDVPGKYVCDLSDNYFTINYGGVQDPQPSLKSSLKVTVLNGGIQCFRAPCEFPLAGATVTLYDANKVLVGNIAADVYGVASFTNLNPGTYTAYASASGYARSSAYTVGLVSGQSGTAKITLQPANTTSQVETDSQLAAVLQSLKGVLSGLSGSIGN